MGTSAIASQAIQAFQAGRQMRLMRQEEQQRALQMQQLTQMLQFLQQAQPLQLQGLQQQITGGGLTQALQQAQIAGQTMEGAFVPEPEGHFVPTPEGVTGWQIPGLRERAELQTGMAGEVAEKQEAGRLRAQLDAQTELIQREITQATAILEQGGFEPGTPEFQAAFRERFKLSQPVSMAGVLQAFGVTVPSGMRDVLLPADTASQLIGRLGTAEITGKYRLSAAQARRLELSPAQETALAEMRKLEIDFQSLDKLFNVGGTDPKTGQPFGPARGLVGAATGRARELARGTLGMRVNRSFNELAVAVARLKNKLLKIRSGAAVTDQEMRRIAQELPNVSDNPQDFQIKLNQGLDDLRAAIEIFMQTAGQPTQQLDIFDMPMPEQ